jgi:hypothetical protein
VEDRSLQNGIPNILEILNYSFHQLNLKDPHGPSRKKQENARDTKTPGVENNQAPKDPAGNK